jgi:hypothetical protein
MTTITFDRLNYLETLKAAGIPEPQARAHAVALDEALRDGISTKDDIRQLEHRLEIMLRDVTIRLGSGLLALGGILIAIKYFG